MKILGKDRKPLVEFPHQAVMVPSTWPGKYDEVTKQCLIEPRPYVMADGSTLPPHVSDLPEINEDHIDRLEEFLAEHRYKPKAHDDHRPRLVLNGRRLT